MKYTPLANVALVLFAGGSGRAADPGPSGFVDSGGVKLHYVAAGQGPLLVLLHGFPDYHYTWRDQVPALSQHFKVVSLDLPGNMRVLGFITRADFSDAPAGIARTDEVAVYLPMSYQIGGYTVFVPKSACTPVEMSREEAMKFILTAGLKSASPSIEPPRST